MIRLSLIATGALLLINAAFMAIVTNIHFGIIALGIFSAAVLAYGMYWHRLGRIKWLHAAFIGVFSVLVLFSGFLATYGNQDDAQYDEDVVIVLGASIRNGQVGPILAQRLDKAVEYYKKNPKAVLVVSGGQGRQEDITEAQAMEQYLLVKGIPAEQIIKEEKSTSTYENFLFSGALLKQKFPQGCSTVFITNYFHIYRAKKMAHITGIAVRYIGASTVWYTIPANYMREILAVMNFWVFPPNH